MLEFVLVPKLAKELVDTVFCIEYMYVGAVFSHVVYDDVLQLSRFFARRFQFYEYGESVTNDDAVGDAVG